MRITLEARVSGLVEWTPVLPVEDESEGRSPSRRGGFNGLGARIAHPKSGTKDCPWCHQS
jgi:hypothetical protein